MDDRLGRLERLQALRESGTLTEAEFEAEKARALGGDRAARRHVTGGILMAGAAVIAVTVGAALWWHRPAASSDDAPVVAENVPKPNVDRPPAPTPILSPQAALASAGRAAFSRVGVPHIHAEKLIPVGNHFAVIGVAEGDGSHASGGTLAIQYVDQTGGSFKKIGPILTEQTGSFGTIGGWKLRNDLGDRPIVTLDGGGTFQGCTSGGTTLIELDDDRPRTLVSFIPTTFEDDSASDHGPSYSGTIERAGDGISVRYTGSVNSTIALRRVGSKLVPDRPLPTGC